MIATARSGGGEGIRTPDPRVANAVLCQLSYTPDKPLRSHFESEIPNWLRGRDLNPRPLGYEPNELPDCSTPRQSQPFSNLRFRIEIPNMVGLGRFELPTSRLSGVRSNQLSYRPFQTPLRANFCRKKEPHFSSLRSVVNGGRAGGPCSFGG